MLRLSIAIVALLAAGCSSVECDCLPCSDGLVLEITHSPGVPAVSGDVELACSTEGSVTRCVGNPAAPGSYQFDVTLAGETRTVTVTAERAPAGNCCGCEWLDRTERVTLELDAAVPEDASTPMDAGAPRDAGRDASSTQDSGAPACRPERVEFPMGGDLSPGTLCDDVFVCVPDASAAAAVVAAAPQFDCTSEPTGSPCDSGVRCAYRDPGGPSTLDEDEIAAICAVTVLEPPPDRVLCRVYL